MIRLTKIMVSIATVVIIAMIAMPQLLSTTYIKKRVANQLSELTGRPVTIQGESSLSLRPYLTVSYDIVNIEDTSSKDGKPLVTIETLRARLNPISALSGNIELAEIVLVRPQFVLKTYPDGRKNWHSKNGVIADRLSAPPEQLTTLPLGNVDVVDGIIKIDDQKNSLAEEITSINGRLVWPDILSPAEVDFTAVWRGENLVSNALINAPFDMLKGGNSNLEFSIKSNPLEAVFSGTTNSAERTASGTLSASTASISRLAEWIRYPVAAAEYMGSGSVSGLVNLSGNAVEFQDAAVKIGNHNSNGRLQFFLDKENILSLNGTLAFDSLDITDWAFDPLKNTAPPNNIIDLSLLKDFRLDLRISANEVSTRSVELNNLAASIIVRDKNATFDIGQAEALGGTVNGSLELTLEDDQASIRTSILLNKIEFEEFVKSYGGSSIGLKGNGSISLKLKSTGNSYLDIVNRLNGEGSVRGKEGTLVGINFGDILNTAEQRPEKIWRSLSGTTEYSDLNLKVFVANGVAFLRGSEIQGTGLAVSIGGRADLAQGNLALRGNIRDTGQTEQNLGNHELSFFVGGTATSPLFVPLKATPNPKKPVSDDGSL